MRQSLHSLATSMPEAAAPTLRIVPLPPAAPRRECVIERDGFRAQVVRSRTQRRRAAELVQRMYSWRGYDTATAAAVSDDPDRITFEAGTGTALYGTLTLGIDGRNGLLVDELYAGEITPFRRPGRKLCELSKLAVDPEHSSKPMLAALIQLAHVHARIYRDMTDAFIEVNPRHALFYQRMLGFKPVGPVRVCPRVDAPAVLLHLELGYMDDQIRTHGGTCPTRDRSLYPYFVPEWKPAPRRSPQERIAQAA